MASSQFQKSEVRVRRTLSFGLVAAFCFQACSTVPEPKKAKPVHVPKNAFVEVPNYPYEVLGEVKTRIDYNALDLENDEYLLCKNAYARAAKDLVRFSRENGGDAVIEMRSVVFNLDGSTENFETPECTDDGAEGQVLARGIAVRWKRDANGRPMGPIETDPDTLPKKVASQSRLKPAVRNRPARMGGGVVGEKKPGKPVYAPIESQKFDSQKTDTAKKAE
ncbi:MAG: hypothetical protein JNL01_06760 [Bdellovibrionales bacterium]|nr:hypothetical protein [Bdellovibrionales bacterium]